MKKKKKRSVFRKRKFHSNGKNVRSFHIVNSQSESQRFIDFCTSTKFVANDNDANNGLPREVA